MAGKEDTVTDPGNMYLVKFLFGGCELRRYDSWDVLCRTSSDEEMDLKLATMGLEVDWSRCHAGTQYRIKRIGE